MSSFLVEYQPFVFILLLIGVCPFRVNLKEQSVQHSSIIFVYTLSFNFILLPTTICLLVYRVITNLEYLIYVEVVANFIIDSLTALIYLAIVFVCIIKREHHMKFLNDIQHFDLITCQTFKLEMIQECLRLRKILFGNILFCGSYFISNLITDYMIQEDGTSNTDIFFRIFLALMLQSMCLVSFHVRTCAQLLIMRFRFVGMRLSKTCHGNTGQYLHAAEHALEWELLFETAEYLFELCEQFEDSFGFIMLLNIILDQLQITITVYMLTMLIFFQTGLSWQLYTMTFLSYFLMPATKVVVLTTVVHQLGQQVNILHVIIE